MEVLTKVMILLGIAFIAIHLGLPSFQQEDLSKKLDTGNEVKMYSLSSCGICRAMKSKLAAAGIPYQEILLDNMSQSEQGELFMTVSKSGAANSGGVPFFQVNGSWIAHRDVQISDIEKELFFK